MDVDLSFCPEKRSICTDFTYRLVDVHLGQKVCQDRIFVIVFSKQSEIDDGRREKFDFIKCIDHHRRCFDPILQHARQENRQTLDDRVP